MARVDYIDFMDYDTPCTGERCGPCGRQERCWLYVDLHFLTAKDERYTVLYSEGECS